MLSLKEQSLLLLSENARTLGDVFEVCKGSGVSRDICSGSRNFWYKILDRLGYGITALCLQPLKARYWNLFIEGMEDGRSYEYMFEITIEFLEPANENYRDEILLYRKNYFGTTGMDLSYVYKVTIPGLRLSSGSHGWIMQFFPNNETDPTDTEFAICSKDQDDRKRLTDIISIYMIKLFREYIINGRMDIEIAQRGYAIVEDQDARFPNYGDKQEDSIYQNLFYIDDFNPLKFNDDVVSSKDDLSVIVNRNIQEVHNDKTWMVFSLLTLFNVIKMNNVRNEQREIIPLADTYSKRNVMKVDIYKCRIY